MAAAEAAAAVMREKLDFYPAYRPTGTGVIVLPGGGYAGLSTGHEGVEPARWLNGLGIDAWVLRYTVAGPATPAPVHPKPLHDGYGAVRAVRATGRVRTLGLWGFSAGGHLAAMVATAAGCRRSEGYWRPDDDDDDEWHPRLDFAILAYPVISMAAGTPTTHEGSVAALLGAHASAALRREMTPSTRVTAWTPPVFLFHTADDAAVPVQNSLMFAAALAAAGRPFELLVLPSGRHGAGMPLDMDARVRWDGELARWLRAFVVRAEGEGADDGQGSIKKEES